MVNSNFTSTRVKVALGSKVDGILPAPLGSLVVSDARWWHGFVDEVDRVSLKAGKVACQLQAVAMLGFVLCLSIALIPFILNPRGGFPFRTFMVGCVLAFFFPVVPIFLHNSQQKRTLEKLQVIAERMSALLGRHNNISVHFREGMFPCYVGDDIGTPLYYFEFIHSASGVPTNAEKQLELGDVDVSKTTNTGSTIIPTIDTTATLLDNHTCSVIKTQPMVASTTKTISERLQDLDSIQRMISPREYDQARESIMTSV